MSGFGEGVKRQAFKLFMIYALELASDQFPPRYAYSIAFVILALFTPETSGSHPMTMVTSKAGYQVSEGTKVDR